VEYTPNLEKETDIQIQEAQRTPIKINKSRPIPIHIVVKIARHIDKGKILSAARQKKFLTHKRRPIELAADLSTASQKGVA